MCINSAKKHKNDFGPPKGEGPIDCPRYVCMSVCMYVCMSVCMSVTKLDFADFLKI